MRIVREHLLASCHIWTRLFLAGGMTVGALVCSGCKRSASVDDAPLDIRGQAIDTGVSNRASSISPGTNAGSSKAPQTSRSATNDTQRMEGEYTVVGFDKLAGYSFEMSDDLLAPATNDTAAATAKTEAQIPAMVKAFDKKRVAVQGFMLPLKVEGGVVTEMLIMKDQSMCCYGVVPKINEWISIKMTRAGVKPIMDQPVTLYGTLRVGEMRENGYLVGIYAMEGEKMATPAEN